MTLYYKFLTRENCGPISNFDFTHCLPQDGEPGPWLPAISVDASALIPCKRGYHYCEAKYLIDWLNDRLYIVEPGMEKRDFGNKHIATRLRFLRHVDTWNERTARLFAADCAEHVLAMYERWYPKDDGPRRAIEAARAYARGTITGDELATAEKYVVRCTVSTVAVSALYAALAAHEAVSPLGGVYLSCKQAQIAAYSNTSPHINRFLAHKRERAWQTMRLLDYLDGEITA